MLGRDIVDKAIKEGTMPETKERSLVQIVISGPANSRPSHD